VVKVLLENHFMTGIHGMIHSTGGSAQMPEIPAALEIVKDIVLRRPYI